MANKVVCVTNNCLNLVLMVSGNSNKVPRRIVVFRIRGFALFVDAWLDRWLAEISADVSAA